MYKKNKSFVFVLKIRFREIRMGILDFLQEICLLIFLYVFLYNIFILVQGIYFVWRYLCFYYILWKEVYYSKEFDER